MSTTIKKRLALIPAMAILGALLGVTALAEGEFREPAAFAAVTIVHRYSHTTDMAEDSRADDGEYAETVEIACGQSVAAADYYRLSFGDFLYQVETGRGDAESTAVVTGDMTLEIYYTRDEAEIIDTLPPVDGGTQETDPAATPSPAPTYTPPKTTYAPAGEDSVQILDGEVPLSGSPDTGDSSRTPLYWALFGISLGALVFLGCDLLWKKL